MQSRHIVLSMIIWNITHFQVTPTVYQGLFYVIRGTWINPVKQLQQFFNLSPYTTVIIPLVHANVHFYIILCRYCGYCQAGKLYSCYHIYFSRSQLLWLSASTRKTWAILHHVLRLSKLFLGTSFTSELWRELGKILNPASQSVTFSRMVNYSWRANI